MLVLPLKSIFGSIYGNLAVLMVLASPTSFNRALADEPRFIDGKKAYYSPNIDESTRETSETICKKDFGARAGLEPDMNHKVRSYCYVDKGPNDSECQSVRGQIARTTHQVLPTKARAIERKELIKFSKRFAAKCPKGFTPLVRQGGFTIESPDMWSGIDRGCPYVRCAKLLNMDKFCPKSFQPNIHADDGDCVKIVCPGNARLIRGNCSSCAQGKFVLRDGEQLCEVSH